MDLYSNKPLEGVSIYNNETQRSTFTDTLGQFEIKDFCSGSYHFILRHIACENKEIYIDLTKDTNLLWDLEHSINLLGTVNVDGRST